MRDRFKCIAGLSTPFFPDYFYPNIFRLAIGNVEAADEFGAIRHRAD